jgi:hypothetical protein
MPGPERLLPLAAGSIDQRGAEIKERSQELESRS